MIVPDVNLLVYAYNSGAPYHQTARPWLEQSLSGQEEVGFPWVVCLGFIRLMTHPAVLQKPMPAPKVLAIVKKWFTIPTVHALSPGPRHLVLMESLLKAAGTAASLTTDAHIAALCIEHQADLYSNDADMARFPGLRWTNPLHA